MSPAPTARLLALLPLAALLALAGTLALPLLNGADPQAVETPVVGRKLPELKLEGIQGAGPGFSSASLLGHVALINAFASWCTPCKVEHPLLLRLAREQHVPIYGLVYRDKLAPITRFLEENGNPYAGVGDDPESQAAIDLGLTGVPETWVVDATGTIRWHQAGPLTPDQVERELKPLLKALGA